MTAHLKNLGAIGGVDISGTIDVIYGDIVGGDKIGLDEERLISLLETHGILVRNLSKNLQSVPPSEPSDRDTARMVEYQRLFKRTAFEIPCIFEGSLVWLDATVDQIQTAFGTGSVKFRGSGDTAYVVARRTEFETEPMTKAIAEIAKMLLLLKHAISALVELIENERPGIIRDKTHIHMEFLMCSMIRSGVDRSILVLMIERMDEIDCLRNVILGILGMKKIPLSSFLLKQSSKMKRNDWNKFYLRQHETINGFLNGTTS